jgi:hypothetical protein
MPFQSSFRGGFTGNGRGYRGVINNGASGSYLFAPTLAATSPGPGYYFVIPFSPLTRFYATPYTYSNYTFEFFTYFINFYASTSSAPLLAGSRFPLNFYLQPATSNINLYWNNVRYDTAAGTPTNPILASSNYYNTWCHWAFVGINGSNQSTYLNGTRIKSANVMTQDTLTNTSPLYVGTNPANGAFGNNNMYWTNIRFVQGTALYTGTTYTVPTSTLQAIPGTTLLLNATYRNKIVDTSSNAFFIQNGGGGNAIRWKNFSPFS